MSAEFQTVAIGSLKVGAEFILNTSRYSIVGRRGRDVVYRLHNFTTGERVPGCHYQTDRPDEHVAPWTPENLAAHAAQMEAKYGALHDRAAR